MKTIKNRKVFGFWDGMPYGLETDSFEECKGYKNTLSKKAVISHIESLTDRISSVMTVDIFTGEEYNSGLYDDGEFMFPVDFLRYYKKYDIGIPPEYEAYVKNIIKAP